MFDSELRDAQRNLRDLQSSIRNMISKYEWNLQSMKKDFSKIDGYAEKQIDALFSEFEKNIEQMTKELKKSTEALSKEYEKQIDEQEKQAIDYLKRYKEDCKREFDGKLDGFFVVKGEL